MTRRQSNLRWSVEQRLEFIEFRLYWEGRINRGDLMRTFGVSVNQASTDLNRYLGLAPENMIYDKSARSYLPSEMFSPLFLELDSDRYLTQLRSVNEGILASENAWLRHYPAYEGAPAPTREVNPETLRVVLAALREEQAVEVRYQSITRPTPRWRWIAPHALGSDGFRWHLRAFCADDKTFKDFLLARIIETKETRPAECDPKDDADWHTYVDLEIGPHPDMSESQRQVIALDYGMQDGQTELRVRKALLFYTLRRLGLDRDAEALQPANQHIVLLNREAIRDQRASADERESA